mmetsp:Transcript_6250/g.10442  ORF Transcript_6250/g.10442 Transcript_6250/m.10442 type:complete len:417 (+) Transcript_6250:31-1281(+)
MPFPYPFDRFQAVPEDASIMTMVPQSINMTEVEKEMLKLFSDDDFEAEVSTGAASSTEDEETPTSASRAALEGFAFRSFPNFTGDSSPKVQVCADDSLRCLARAVVSSVLFTASTKLVVAQGHEDAASSDGSGSSDDFVVFDPAMTGACDDDSLATTAADSEKSGLRVLDQIHGKLGRVSVAAHRNAEKVFEVVHQNLQYVAAKSKSVSQAARATSLPRLSEAPKAASQAAVAQSARMQKGARVVKSRTKELANDTIEFVKEKAEMVWDAACTVYVAVSDKAHTGYDLVRDKAEMARETAHAVSTTVSEKAFTGFDFVKEKADIARGTAQAVSVTVSEKAHTGFDLAKEKAQAVSEKAHTGFDLAKGKAQAVSTTVSEKAYTGFDLAKEKARAMRDGNCMQAVHAFQPRIRPRGGA